jgi:hypothetical protein
VISGAASPPAVVRSLVEFEASPGWDYPVAARLKTKSADGSALAHLGSLAPGLWVMRAMVQTLPREKAEHDGAGKQLDALSCGERGSCESERREDVIRYFGHRKSEECVGRRL